jgi:L-ascorbate metabolism protein UlaG (beta-lactamase superfamily)
MKIKFYAHASFRLEGDGLAIITDPYTPGPEGSNFEPINEPADIVIRSSDDDDFHCNASHILGDPVIVDAVDVPPAGATVKGLHIRAIPSAESQTYDYGRAARDNAMYTFSLEGIRFLHLGDIGNPFGEWQLGMLEGQVDVMLVLTGGQPTITLDDLDQAINIIGPRIVIPMHYYHPRGVLNILPVTDFTDRQPRDQVTWVGDTELELTQETLPPQRRIYVLEQSR